MVAPILVNFLRNNSRNFEFFVLIKVKFRSFADNFTQLYHMFHRKCYQENWDKSSKLVGQMLELVGHLSH